MIHRLGRRHVIAVDQRGHGRSGKSEITHWKVFGEDLAAFVRALDLHDIVGVGHSMGGHASTEAAAACPPEIEASICMTSRTNPGVYDSIRALEIPVLILRAKQPPDERSVMDFSSSPTWPGVVHEFRHGRGIHFADRTHFLPMEIPEKVARLILQELGSP